MKLSSIRSSFCILLLYAVQSLHADSLVLGNGQTLTGISFRRTGDSLVVTTEVQGPDGKPMSSDHTVPLKDISRVECAPSPAAKNAGGLLAKGDTAAALAVLKPAVVAAEPFGDLPGSPWPDLAVVYAQSLLAAGDDAGATLVINKLSKATSTAIQTSASALGALCAALKGDHEKAISLATPALQPRENPSATATASIARGLVLLARKNYGESLLGFLEQPVFAPDATALAAMAQFGAAECYAGMDDMDRAISTLEELLKAQPSGPASKPAKTLLEKCRRRKQALEDSKR